MPRRPWTINGNAALKSGAGGVDDDCRGLKALHCGTRWPYSIRGHVRGVAVFLSERDVLRMLRKAVEEAGNQSEWSRRTGIERTYLNQVLQGRKKISQRILKALKLKKIFLLFDSK